MEMNFCRRCGSALTAVNGHTYKCQNGHTLYANASPTTCLWLINDSREVLVVVRSREPGLGKFDAPGGFNDGAETSEEGLAREVREEIGLQPTDYTTPQYLLSALDQYHFGGENVTVIDHTFWARIIGTPKLTPADDVGEAYFVPIDEIDPETIFFDSVRASFIALRDSGLV